MQADATLKGPGGFAAVRTPGLSPAVVLQGFIILQIVTQLAVLVPGFNSVRLVARGGVFVASIALLLLVRGRPYRHPAQPAALAALAVMAVALANPLTTSIGAGIAQIALYVAIMAPLIWVTRLGPDLAAMRRCLMLLWSFQLLSAVIGILQVYFPGSLQPQLSPVIVAQGRGYLESLMITNANGIRVYRPMGLTDIPGGAASAGFISAFLGMGFFLTARNRYQAAIAALSVLLGLACLYLSQVRAMLVVTLICGTALAGLLILRRGIRQSIGASVVLTLAVVAGFQLAFFLGSTAVSHRVSTLTANSPLQVYQANRGGFLEHTIMDLLPRYPLGAGPGRFGMMALYFGSDADPTAPGLWAEIQWTAWLLDGGVPLILAYVLAILIVLRTAFRISRLATGPQANEISLWAVVILAYGISILALTFSYPVFVSQAGLEFWLINAMLHAAALRAIERARTA